jgi:hypothetical protein
VHTHQPHNMRLVFRCCLIACLLLPFKSGAQEAVPIYREPRHRLVLDSTRFRVLDVQIPPNDTTRYHIHNTAILYVAILTSPTSAQILGSDWPTTPATPPFAAVGEVRIDSTYVSEPVTHRVTNAGSGLFRLLAITSSGPARESASAGPQAGPGVMELRSTWFEQSRVQLAERATTAWFVPASPLLVVQLRASRLALECDGSARQTLDQPGSWLLVPVRTRCRIINDGSESATAVAIHIK